MALLAGVHYDPSTAVSKATTAALAMTAFDTTNLRLSFTVPANGSVLVRIRCVESGATTYPVLLLGVLQSSTVVGRMTPAGDIAGTNLATTGVTNEALFTVTGLTPGSNLTWDAAYGVELLKASTAIHYGGPDDTTANNAWGGIVFEIWEAPNLLTSILYDPSTASVSNGTAANQVMTALDTTNLRATFTVPASGNVLVHMKAVIYGAATYPQILLGVMNGSTVVGRGDPLGTPTATALATTPMPQESLFLVTGLTSGSNLTWDAAYGVETGVSGSGIRYGGPNNTTASDAYGGFLFEIWGA